MAETKTGLEPGGNARIYRDGEILCATVAVDQDGRLDLRQLQPGGYVARDESGGEFAFLLDRANGLVIPVKEVGPDGHVVRRDPPAKRKPAKRKPAKKPAAKKKG